MFKFRRKFVTRHAQRDKSMKKDDHIEEGIRKLHAEILQLHNQRFLLTTSAVVFYGTVAGWVTTIILRPEILTWLANGKNEPGRDSLLVQYFLPFMTVLVWTVLYALFRYQVSLAFTVRWLATYHMYKGSDWEWTWHSFRWLQRENKSNKKPHGEEPFSAYGVNPRIFEGLFIITYGYFLFLYSLIFGVIDLSAVLRIASWREYFNSQLIWDRLSAAAGGEPSKLITPRSCWIVLIFTLFGLLWHMRRKDYKANNPDEQNLLERWQEAAKKSQTADNKSDCCESSISVSILGHSTRKTQMFLDTKLISSPPQDVALDESEVRTLCRVSGGSMAHFTLAPKAVSKAIVLPDLEEVWYFISGRGRMWRQLASREETVDVGPGVCITIPAGTHFQFRSDDFEPLKVIGATMPPWTPEKAGHIVEGPWEPTV